MDTQNTPVHIRLWHRGFWALSIASMLLAMGLYSLLLTADDVVGATLGDPFNSFTMAFIMGIYVVGMVVVGPFTAYLVARYPRKQVCLLSVVGMMAAVALLYFGLVETLRCPEYYRLPLLIVSLFLAGAFFGTAQRVLCAVLIVDICEATYRTEANYASGWFTRFAISIGPVVALLMPSSNEGWLLTEVFLAASLVLVAAVKIQFKVPEETKLISLDHFLLPQGGWLFVLMVMVMAVMGMSFVIAGRSGIHFFAFLMLGFFFAILAEKFAFVNADLKSEFMSGVIVALIAFVLLLTRGNMPVVSKIAPVMIGFGVGTTTSRMLMFLIKLSRHCQRSTSISTYYLSWHVGFALGLFLGFSPIISNPTTAIVVSIAILLISALSYNFYIHEWYMKHKNR